LEALSAFKIHPFHLPESIQMRFPGTIITRCIPRFSCGNLFIEIKNVIDHDLSLLILPDENGCRLLFNYWRIFYNLHAEVDRLGELTEYSLIFFCMMIRRGMVANGWWKLFIDG
jgi:hypothetical protein